MKKLAMWAGIVGVTLTLAPGSLLASDHADPVQLSGPGEPNITGLFAFPDGDQLVVVLNVFPRLAQPAPYDLESYTFHVYMDLHSEVSYSKAEHRARYGGEVKNPEGISADVSIEILLNNDASWKDATFEGLSNDSAIRTWSGVRDDPFIFPRFGELNVVSMVMSIPFASFPAGQQDWLLWAQTREVEGGDLVDFVGRSARTQAPRFSALFNLNEYEPKDHVPQIEKHQKKGNKIHRGLMNYLAPGADLYQYLLELRPYDAQPDVMIFTTRFPPGYPNGRQLTDDIVGLTCAQGDCILQETAFTEGKVWPRTTINDKSFLTEFPYLADPWPDRPPEKEKISWWKWIFLLILAVVLFFVVRWWLRRRHQKKHPHGDGG